jgi:hypothetical protein
VSRIPKTPFTPKQVATYLKDQIAVRGERGLKVAFTNQFFNHFETGEIENIIISLQKELDRRSDDEIQELREKLEAKSGKTVELK